MQTTKPFLIGRWEKLTDSPCCRVYPRIIEFTDDGLYSGTGMETGTAPGWDRGTWEIVNATQIKFSTMNDAVLTYGFSLLNNILTFESPDNCAFMYRKINH